MAQSPTSRTLNLLREEGYTCQVVEKYISWTKQRIDLFGFIDIVAMKEGQRGLVGIQTTTGSHIAERIKKAKSKPELELWLLTGNKVEFHGWRKLKTRGENGKYWQVDRRKFTLKDLEEGDSDG